MKTPLVLRYFIGSMLIFAISMIVLSVRGLRPLEMQSTSFRFGRSYRSYVETPQQTNSPVVVFQVYEQMSQEMFLGVAKDIIHRLKKVGAKAVIVPLPDYVRPSPSVMKSIQEIVRDSIAIFGIPRLTNGIGIDFRLDDRKQWWVRHPLYHKADITWGVMSDAPRDFSFLIPFVPTGYRDDQNGIPVPDVGVLALKRFFSIPDNAELPTAPSRLQIGEYVIPIEHDGVCYTRFQISTKRWVELSATYPVGKDSIQYFAISSTDGSNRAAIDTAWRAHKGKIVIIEWIGLSRGQFFDHAWAYAQIINSVFTRTFVRMHNEWNILLITTLVILLSVLSYTIRNGYMIFISLVLAAGSMAVSVWLFDAHNVLFEPVYIMVPIVLSGIILPIVKVLGEKRLAEEKIRSMEEENRRLSDLLRPPSTGSHS